MKLIREFYGVPAKRGMSILFRGEKYFILSARYLKLRVWNAKGTITINPTWQVDYRDGKGIRSI